MEDKIQPFRQPIITGGGIILGFILNFAAEFVKTDTKHNTLAFIIGGFTLIGVIFIIISMARILNFNYPKDKADIYYQKTYLFFIMGIIFSFIGVFINMTITFFT
ncbi:hypothetical protein [Echinicola vietnamensis]|uniref:Uncharacterized protein n=1 Tax=Echinicola vietnamensis (strain DSM 17526 / LMG 23754 / KMM 6221) TaxID=926556 RepID=L0FVE4_ECHVK|nr:hypothetical protein [Echinicola vietnamensis]AGA77869.1 hypothetical protein Echvi_1604 [Echinicola vietnamensis DSM 17526]